MATINLWRLQTLIFVSAFVIGGYLPSAVQSVPDCGLASSWRTSRRPRGGRSHAFSSSSSADPQVLPAAAVSRPSEKLRINNLLGATLSTSDNSSESRASHPPAANIDIILDHHHRRAAATANVARRANRKGRGRGGRRKGRIIMGRETEEGEFPWQASLQLLHPVLGHIGHWCGGVLIHQNWILSAAHCVHNDLFNLAVPAAWSVVLGDYDRHIESGQEQRIAIDRIVMHNNYENYQHDVVLMRLARPANIQADALARKICLPFVATSSSSGSSSSLEEEQQPPDSDDNDPFDGSSNQLRKLQIMWNGAQGSSSRRRNDKFIKERRSAFNRVEDDRQKYATNVNHYHFDTFDTQQQDHHQRYHQHQSKAKVNDLPYRDCIATGWGMMTANGELTDILLQSKVPLLSNNQCQRAYRGYVKIHSGHLCGGKTGGEGGTCVGDSGGPLQCRITENGPWILAGITSFGWNCSENVPDVFTRISFYVNWITDTINER